MTLLELVTGAWAITPEMLDEIRAVYATHLRGDKIDVDAIEARLGRPLAAEQKEYELHPGGVAVLHAQGVMAPKANMFMRISGGISTSMLARQLDGIAADPRARSALIVWDSPGGSVAAVPQAGDAMRRLAEAKPTVSVADNTMASAAYWVGSAANAVYASGATDVIGSIGVIGRLEWDPADPNAIELVRGRYKRAGINGAPPSAEVLQRANEQMDYLYQMFVDTVAANRGASVDAVLEHMADGLVFYGQQAVSAGLVDGVATVPDLLDELAANPEAFRARRKAVIAASAAVFPVSEGAGAAREDASVSPIETAAVPAVPSQADTTSDEGEATMANPITREDLERDHAALFGQLRSEFGSAGASAERARIQSVMALRTVTPGHDALIERMAMDGQSTAGEVALAIAQAEQATRAAAAAAHAGDAPVAAPSAPAPDDKPKDDRSIGKAAVALFNSFRKGA